tara:strand:- start:9796 stop:11001 length:1206 start_codon:yes stop_codon:yes gene_type:complete
MKIAYSFLPFIPFLFYSLVQAQNDSFVFVNETDLEFKNKGVKVEGLAFVGSNSLNTKMFTDVLIHPTFSEQGKSAFLDGNQLKTNLFASNKWGLEYQKDSNTYFFIRNKSLLAFSSDKDFSELLFFGNSPFRDKKVSTRGLNYFQANIFSAGYGFDIYRSKNISIKSALGLSTLNNFSQIEASEIQLYTASDGSYLEATFKNTSINEAKSGIQGVGLSADICLDYRVNDLNTISFEADDVNGFYLFDNQETQIDTSFNFNGVSIDIFNAETSVVSYLDSAFTETINRNKTTQNQAFLPIKMKLQWMHKLNPRATLASSVESLSKGKFGTYLETALIYTHNRQLRTRTSIGFGDFRGFTWSESLEYRTIKYNFYLGLNNLQAIAAPIKTRNYGFSFGLFRHL